VGFAAGNRLDLRPAAVEKGQNGLSARKMAMLRQSSFRSIVVACAAFCDLPALEGQPVCTHELVKLCRLTFQQREAAGCGYGIFG
jgi:hypothetical protein